MSNQYPYAETLGVNRRMPAQGRPRNEVLAELQAMADGENAMWETGKCSGTMYCGDHDHYDFMQQAFGMYAHMNALQRDMCPSATRFEGEIIAMTLDMLHGDAVEDGQPGGLVTSGGTGSILHAVLAFRERAAAKGITSPNFVKPETGHPAFNKACHLFGIEVRSAPVNPDTTLVEPDAMAALIDDNTIGMMGSATNYGYGTIDPIEELGAIGIERDIPLHVDGCLGGFILPWGEKLGIDIATFDFRVPGVTTISADTHKYGYGFKGTSVLLFRDMSWRNGQYFFLPEWTGGKYCSAGMDGSRSNGLLAATWAAMVSLGEVGYLNYAKKIFDTSFAMQDAVRQHPELRIMGDPTFCFSFTSDAFDIFHVNDHMRAKGWRFNGQQYPNAIHMAVTRPQTEPGVADTFATDLAEAVEHARQHADEAPVSGAIYGGVEGGYTEEADEFLRVVMAKMMDDQQAVPAPGG